MTAVLERCSTCHGITTVSASGEVEVTHAKSCPHHWRNEQPAVERRLVACAVCDGTLDVTDVFDVATRVQLHSREQHPARVTGRFREVSS